MHSPVNLTRNMVDDRLYCVQPEYGLEIDFYASTGAVNCVVF
jgi:hypothetical protein